MIAIQSLIEVYLWETCSQIQVVTSEGQIGAEQLRMVDVIIEVGN